jgi:hypothetical protein
MPSEDMGIAIILGRAEGARLPAIRSPVEVVAPRPVARGEADKLAADVRSDPVGF